ncbi:MAG: hypothetical protein M0Q42_10610 [Xanthomonadales bacterium]|nr:hypothetical protein [Xanthomonadales bacterium]
MNIIPHLLDVRAAKRRWLHSGSGADLEAWLKACHALDQAHALMADGQRVAAAKACRARAWQAQTCSQPGCRNDTGPAPGQTMSSPAVAQPDTLAAD